MAYNTTNPRLCKTVNIVVGTPLVIADTDSITAFSVPPISGATFLGTATGSVAIDISNGVSLGFGDRPMAGTITATTTTIPCALWY